MKLFRIKICGVTTAAAVDACLAAGVDAIGLNCFAQSKRYVEPSVAKELTAAIPSNVARVGVFVNEKIETVLRLAEDLALSVIQLHGDEDAEYTSQLGGHEYLRAFRFGPEGYAPIIEFMSAAAELDCPPSGILIDAHVPGTYGGTGTVADWQRIAAEKRQIRGTKMILAGGLTAENVTAAIGAVDPWGVDTASGVELEPGIKNAELSTLFVKRAHMALGI